MSEPLPPADWLYRADRQLARVEGLLLVVALFAMFLTAGVQLSLRKLNAGFGWADILVQQLVMCVAFLGAARATHERRHIAIDAATKWMTSRSAAALRAITGLGAAAITIILTRVAITYWLDELNADTELVGAVRLWWFSALIPIGLGCAAFHFCVGVWMDVSLSMGLSAAPDSTPPSWRILLGVLGIAAVGAATSFAAGWGAWAVSATGVALLAAAGMPLFAAIGAFTMLGYAGEEVELSTVPLWMAEVMTEPTLVALPFFTFSGYLMAESRAPHRLVSLARALVGWLPGGVAIVAVVACAFFTAFTGASGVTIIALGGLLFPILKSEGFPEKFSLGLLTSGGSLGLLFPPSLPVILYAIVAGIGHETLFAAALLPGLLLVLFMAAYSGFVATVSGNVERIPFRWTSLRNAFRDARWELPTPIFVITSIYAGWLTVSEAAAATVVAVIVVQCGIYRDLSLRRDIPNIAVKSAVLIGAILLILGVARAFTDHLTVLGVPDDVLTFVENNVSSKLGFLIALNIFLLLVGCVLDVFSAIIVVVPLLLPLAKAYDVDPLHLGVIFLTNLEIGYMTPPVGMNLFLSSFRFQRSLPTLYAASLPFILVLLAALLLITYVPQLSLVLVSGMPA